MTGQESRGGQTAKEIIAMLDAIGKKEKFVLPIAVQYGGLKEMSMELNAATVHFEVDGRAVGFADSITARNLAGALVAWANQRDGLTPTPAAMTAAMVLFGWAND